MKRHTRYICFLLFAVVGIAAFARTVDKNNEYNMAVAFEKNGEYIKAESLFVSLFEATPDNYNYYNRYKNILITQRKYADVIPVIEQRFTKRPYDKYLKLELGVAYYAIDKKRKASDLWIAAFKGQKNNTQRSYANTIYYKVLEFGLGSDFHLIVDELRKNTLNPRLLVENNFAMSLRYRNWDAAVNEILHILETDHADLKYVRSNLFRYDPLSALYQRAIHALEKTKSIYGMALLSDIYIHLSQYEKAFEILGENENNEYLKITMSNFANRMFDQGKYELAARSARWVESLTPDQHTRKRSMAFLAAQADKKLFYELTDTPAIIPYPYKSDFLTIKFIPFTSIEAQLIESAYFHYDSLSGNDHIGESAAIAHAEISHKIYQDFDLALNEFLSISNRTSLNSKVRVITEISKLYAAKGEYDRSLEFIRNSAEKFNLMVHEEDRLMPTEFYLSIIAGEKDSLLERSQDVLAMLPLDDPMYNDILAYTGIVNIVLKDSLNYDRWLEAERHILKNNTASAIDIYNNIISENSPAKKIYALRYLDCLEVQDDTNAELLFWEDHYEELLKTDMADHFMLRYAGLMEKMKKFDISYEIFEKYLLSYQESMYYENIREYVRQHYSLGAP